MSEIELPKPAAWRWPVGEADTVYREAPPMHVPRGLQTLFTAEQVRQLIAAERERCARVCEELWMIDGTHTAKEFAAAIRRGSV